MDNDLFRALIESACRKVAQTYQARPNLTEKMAAIATLDGIFTGCLACSKALGENPYDGGIMEHVREITEKYHREIMIGRTADE